MEEEYKEIIFKEFIGKANNGRFVTMEEFKKEESKALTKDDNDPKTRPLPERKYCEFCLKNLEEIKKHLTCDECLRVRYCNKDCQTKHLEIHGPNCKIQCEVIFTYAYKKLQGQEVYNIYMNKNITEKEFVTQILDTIPIKSKNMHDLKHLMKLSTCTFSGRGISPYPFLSKNNGKYFFNNKLSPALLTRLWQNFLKGYIDSRLQKSL